MRRRAGYRAQFCAQPLRHAGAGVLVAWLGIRAWPGTPVATGARPVGRQRIDTQPAALAQRPESGRSGGPQHGPERALRQHHAGAGRGHVGGFIGGSGWQYRLCRSAGPAYPAPAGAASPRALVDSGGAGRRHSGLPGGYRRAPVAPRPRAEAGRADFPAGRAAIHLAGMEGAQTVDLISIQHLGVGQRLMDINLTLKAGEMLGVIGANGAGKSTLLHCLAGIQDHQGEIHLAGTAIRTIPERQRAQQLGFLPQSNSSAWALTVRDVISLGRLPWGDDKAAAAAGVDAWLDRQVDQLSGGQQARVWLARVLAGQPRVILADEPVASLDLFQQQNVLRLLRRYAQSGRAVMLSVHDLSLAARY